MILLGTGLFFASMWMHSQFTIQTGIGDTLIPMILRGVGLGCIFVPLTQAAVADLVPAQMAQGTGLFNLSRQLGGSFGIAVAATLLTRFTETARTAMLPHVTASDPAAVQWIEGVTRGLFSQGGSADAARMKAYALLNATVQRQAAVVAFEKVFLVMGVTFICALPLLLMFRKGRAGVGAGMAH
jgi:DHA2 family multidrug resistance protein